jgi:DNA-binding response OmpR family regulator
MATERRKKILIVDDEESIRVALHRYVTNAGYDYVTASDGQEALAIISKDVPDLVLLDLMLPGLNGFEICRRIRADKETAKLPVIIVTGLHSEADSADARASGANAFLTKPVKAEDLMRVIHQYAGSPFKL